MVVVLAGREMKRHFACFNRPCDDIRYARNIEKHLGNDDKQRIMIM